MKTHAFGMVILEIVGIRHSDEGKYTCVATNKGGKAESGFSLCYSSKDDNISPRFTSQLQVELDPVQARVSVSPL